MLRTSKDVRPFLAKQGTIMTTTKIKSALLTAIFLAGLLLSACASSAIAEEMPSARLSDDLALARSTISLLQTRDFATVRGRFDPWVLGAGADDALRRMSDALGHDEPTSVHVVSAKETHDVQSGDGSSRILLEYQFGSKWIVADATVKTVGADKRLIGLHFTVNALPSSELNAFRLVGKGASQYLFLLSWLLTIALTGWAMYLALRRQSGWRRWLLVAMMPLGLTPAMAMNWNSAQIFILEAFSNPAGSITPIFSIRYPMALLGHTETGAPYLCVSAPLLAVAYLVWLRMTRKSQSASAITP
jgi:hypothetical protein